MEGNIRKIDRKAQQKRKRKKKNKRHPIEKVILAIILIVIVFVTMQKCSKENKPSDKETTQENSTEYQTEESFESNDETEASTEELIESFEETTEDETVILTTDSVWEDSFETVDSEINNTEDNYIKYVLKEWSSAGFLFNLMMGDLKSLFDVENLTALTEEMNELQKRYLLSNIIIKSENIIGQGTFVDKYAIYEKLITDIKENLESGVSFSRRYTTKDYIGYKAPFQNALGLVPSNYEELADNLKHLGITLNIISKEIEPQEDWTEYVTQLHRYGIAAGIELPYDGMEYSTWEEFKKVYQPIIDAGLDYIVLSDKVFPFITGNEPATFSKRFIQKIRSEMGFNGVIVSFDMSSSEIQEYIAEKQIQEPLLEALLQGCDMVQVIENFWHNYAKLVAFAADDKISVEKLKVSAQRVLNVAYLYNDLYDYSAKDNEDNNNEE